MTKYHLKKDGTPGICKATVKPCPIGGEHFSSKEEAQVAGEKLQSETLGSGFAVSKKAKQSLIPGSPEAILAYERSEFFKEGNKHNYTLINIHTGSIFGTDSIVLEDPETGSLGEFEDWDGHRPSYFTDKPELNPQPITAATDLSGYKNPIIIEPDTETVEQVNGLYAVNTGKYEVDFEEILEDDSAAAEAATTLGFKLWD